MTLTVKIPQYTMFDFTSVLANPTSQNFKELLSGIPELFFVLGHFIM